ncbi:MAG: (d)CMP kinase [Candidatus Omnitrophica bacterium]|nr:(d)CMP kinase [Candidatus Omnitrophota bacterium]
MCSADNEAQRQRRTTDKVIAIDGPAGSGKSTVAKELARRLGFLYVDTGAMYRALTLKAIGGNVDLEDAEALTELAKVVDIQLDMQGEALEVKLDGQDVSGDIRQPSITEKVKFVARIPSVRTEMVRLQRTLAAQSQGAVLEGRDIGTVVFPNARHKFYLDAQAGERAKRRHKELTQMGQQVSLEELTKEINERDKSDMEREVAPLTRAADAIYVDTTHLTIEQVVLKIIGLCST